MKNFSLLGLVLLPLSVCFANADNGIGRITQLDSTYWDVFLRSGHGDKRAVKGAVIHEHDTLQTIVGQHVKILMDDGTELMLGPSSRLIFSNWTERGQNQRLRRMLTLQTGILKAKVRKIYSQEEPFLIENINGVVAVRGTEFVVETGTGGRLENDRSLTSAEAYVRRTEVEVHTLEGEVQFARTFEDLIQEERRVSILAGQTSVIRYGMPLPQTPHSFEAARFQRYLARAFPGMGLNVVKNTSNERRAERAENNKLEPPDQISPAKPSPVNPSRGIASVPAGVSLTSPSRRQQLLGNAPTVDQQVARHERQERRQSDGNGVHDAFTGGDRTAGEQK